MSIQHVITCDWCGKKVVQSELAAANAEALRMLARREFGWSGFQVDTMPPETPVQITKAVDLCSQCTTITAETPCNPAPLQG